MATHEYICPVCGKVIKAPCTEEQIIEHLKTHPESKTQMQRILKLGPRKKGG
jgi:hypothetical protein